MFRKEKIKPASTDSPWQKQHNVDISPSSDMENVSVSSVLASIKAAAAETTSWEVRAVLQTHQITTNTKRQLMFKLKFSFENPLLIFSPFSDFQLWHLGMKTIKLRANLPDLISQHRLKKIYKKKGIKRNFKSLYLSNPKPIWQYIHLDRSRD